MGKNELYESPLVEVIEVDVEQGFASSGDAPAPTYEEDRW